VLVLVVLVLALSTMFLELVLLDASCFVSILLRENAYDAGGDFVMDDRLV
jgi:hypothetical protein